MMVPDPNLPDPNQPDPLATKFHEHIEPMLQDHCQSCHRLGGIAPFNLLTYEDAKIWAPQIVTETEQRTMPPFHAQETADCQPRFGWVDDKRLTDEQIDLFKKWVSDGMVQGDMAKAPAPKVFDESEGRVRDPDVSFSPLTPFMVQGSRDQFRCFVIDPELTEDKYVSGAGFVAGNSKVVHHAIAFLDPGRSSLQHAPVGGSYECFAGTGFQDTSVLYAWAPGANPAELPPGTAFQIPARSLIVLQVHYHPLPNAAEEDQSALELRYLNGRPTNIAQILLIGNFDQPFGENNGLMPGMNDRGMAPEFRIPAGEAAHVEEQRFTLPETLEGFPIPDLKVIAAATHMHYVGTDMRWGVEHAVPKEGEPQKECMIQTPKWDFQWQRGYAYDTPMANAPEFRPHDTLWIRCQYNNTMDNPFVAKALQEQGLSAPKDVYLGEETLDEMCLAVMTIAFPNPF